MKRIVLIISFSALLISCSFNRVITNVALDYFKSGIKVIYQEDDLELAEQFIASNLKTIETFLEDDPENRELNLIAAQSYGSYSMGFVEDYNRERAEKLYYRGLIYALNALHKNKRFDRDVSTDKLNIILARCTPDDVPALFWIGFNWGSYLLYHLDEPENLISLPKIELIMNRVIELDERYYFGGAHLFLGVYYSARPEIFGGDLKRGKSHFLRNSELNGDSLLLSDVLYARYYAVQTQDIELFDKLINKVIETDIDKYPQIRLINSIAKRKALILKSNKDLYF